MKERNCIPNLLPYESSCVWISLYLTWKVAQPFIKVLSTGLLFHTEVGVVTGQTGDWYWEMQIVLPLAL